jgi:hypothetical protein
MGKCSGFWSWFSSHKCIRKITRGEKKRNQAKNKNGRDRFSGNAGGIK